MELNKIKPISEVTNEDCMLMMARYPDKFFDLAIVDPPYGIGEDGKGVSRSRGGNVYTNFEKKEWDNKRPEPEYWQELFRVSKNQIVFGANYFTDFLKPSMGWIFWDKLLGGDFSDGELIFTSFERALRKFTKSPEKNYATNAVSAAKYKRIHPCQKPKELYNYILKNYAKPGNKILDTHLGSGSSRIVAYKLGFDFWGTELDEDYFKAQQERFDKAIFEPLFDSVKKEATQQDFFK